MGYDTEQVDFLMEAIKEAAQKAYKQLLIQNEEYTRLKILQSEIEEMHRKAKQILKSAEKESSLKMEKIISEAEQQADQIRLGIGRREAEGLLNIQEMLGEIEKKLTDIQAVYDTYRPMINKNIKNINNLKKCL